MNRTRSRTPEPPYCWMSKEACRLIRDRMDGESLQAMALAVYRALSEIASDNQAETFKAAQSYIGRVAGDVSTKSVQRVLPILRELGVISYETPSLRQLITFSMLSVETVSRNDATDGPSVETISPSVRTEAFLPLSPTLEGTKKEHIEGTLNNTPAVAGEVDSNRVTVKASKPKKAKPSPEDDPAFMEFWNAYPRKVNRPDAFTAWRKAILPAQEDILTAIAAQSATDQWQRESGKYIPYPASWLNKEGWNNQATINSEEKKSYEW